jgi:hypothetical protein
MPDEITQKLNKRQHEEEHLPCATCHGRTTHKVLTDVQVSGSECNGSYMWSDHHELVQCLGCKSISYRAASSNSEDYDRDEEGNVYHSVAEKLYPPRMEGRKRLEEDWHLPNSVRILYEETLAGLVGQLRILSGIGLRALIEAVCKEKEAVGRDLLRDKGVLTPTGAEILHQIRLLGNEAAHEVKPQKASQLGLAMDVVEHLLKDVYILPARAKREFGDAEKRKKQED